MVQNLALFVVSSIIFILTPGLDTIFVVNKSLTENRNAGLVSAFGISFGIIFHTVLASLGLSIILAKSIVAFSVIKYLGAAYLIYLGIKTIRSKGVALDLVDQKVVRKTNVHKVFWAATLTNILNPKVILFFLAFFPQFVKTESGSASQAFLFLGALYAVMCLVWLSVLSYLVSMFGEKIKNSARAQNVIQKVSGVAFVVLGLKIAFGKK